MFDHWWGELVVPDPSVKFVEKFGVGAEHYSLVLLSVLLFIFLLVSSC